MDDDKWDERAKVDGVGGIGIWLVDFGLLLLSEEGPTTLTCSERSIISKSSSFFPSTTSTT